MRLSSFGLRVRRAILRSHCVGRFLQKSGVVPKYQTATAGATQPGFATAIEMLLNHASLALEEPAVVSNALQHFRRRPALGFSDGLMLEIARKAGHLPLGTFDRNLGGFRALKSFSTRQQGSCSLAMHAARGNHADEPALAAQCEADVEEPILGLVCRGPGAMKKATFCDAHHILWRGPAP